MKKLFFIQLLIIALLSYTTTSFAGSNAPGPLLTNEQKQKEIDHLVKYVEKQKMNAKKQASLKFHLERRTKNLCTNTSDESCIYERKAHQREIKIQRHREQGRYRIQLAYINDNNFSHEYHFFEPFESLSNSDAKRYEKEVYGHYLGANYELHEPELSRISGDRVVIYLYLTPEELKYFSLDTRIWGIGIPANQSFEGQN